MLRPDPIDPATNDPQGSQRPGKRKRLLKACDPCHKSKRRCDGNCPCQNCDYAGKACVYRDSAGNEIPPPNSHSNNASTSSPPKPQPAIRFISYMNPQPRPLDSDPSDRFLPPLNGPSGFSPPRNLYTAKFTDEPAPLPGTTAQHAAFLPKELRGPPERRRARSSSPSSNRDMLHSSDLSFIATSPGIVLTTEDLGVDPLLCRDLVNLFFVHMHPLNTMLHRPTFLNAMATAQVPTFLLNAIFALAAPLSRHPSLQPPRSRRTPEGGSPPPPWHAGERFAQAAIAELSSRSPTGKMEARNFPGLELEVAQTFCCLSIHESVMRRPGFQHAVYWKSALNTLVDLGVPDWDVADEMPAASHYHPASEQSQQTRPRRGRPPRTDYVSGSGSGRGTSYEGVFTSNHYHHRHHHHQQQQQQRSFSRVPVHHEAQQQGLFHLNAGAGMNMYIPEDAARHPDPKGVWRRRECHRRTLWVVYFSNMLASAFALTPKRFQEIDVRLYLPVDEGIFDMVLTDDVVPEYLISSHNDGSGGLHSRMYISEFGYLLRLAAVYSNIMGNLGERIAECKELRSPYPNMDRDELVRHSELALEKWAASLPDRLQWTKENVEMHMSNLEYGISNGAWSFAYMHALAKCSVLAIHSLLELGANQEAKVQHEQYRDEAREMVVYILKRSGPRAFSSLYSVVFVYHLGASISPLDGGRPEQNEPVVEELLAMYQHQWGVHPSQLLSLEFRTQWVQGALDATPPTPQTPHAESRARGRGSREGGGGRGGTGGRAYQLPPSSASASSSSNASYYPSPTATPPSPPEVGRTHGLYSPVLSSQISGPSLPSRPPHRRERERERERDYRHDDLKGVGDHSHSHSRYGPVGYSDTRTSENYGDDSDIERRETLTLPPLIHLLPPRGGPLDDDDQSSLRLPRPLRRSSSSSDWKVNGDDRLPHHHLSPLNHQGQTAGTSDIRRGPVGMPWLAEEENRRQGS